MKKKIFLIENKKNLFNLHYVNSFSLSFFFLCCFCFVFIIKIDDKKHNI